VKDFIFEDFETKYENTRLKKIPSKQPEAIFYNSEGEEIEKIDIHLMTRAELNDLMISKGVEPKSTTGRQEF